MKRFACFLFVVSHLYLVAAENEIIPGDYDAPPIGTDLLTLYLSDRQMVGPYVGGHKLTNERVTSLITALKYTKTVDIYGYTFCPTVVLPYAATTSGGSATSHLLGEKSIGYADLIMGVSGWLINNRTQGRYLAATALIFVPTGKYSSQQKLNIGENRYKATLNIGYVEKISKNFIVEVSPEVAFYGQNTDSFGYRIGQKTGYALTGSLRYVVIPQSNVYLSAVQNFGGSSSINGVWQNDARKTQKMAIGGYYYTKSRTQILFRHSKEFGAQNGMQTSDDYLIRFQWKL
jgi:hypothetical protein